MMPPQPGSHPAPAVPDEVPPPPRGPGVLAPFVAPPRDRDLRGLWWSLGIGGLVLVLCCAGSVVGVGFLVPYLDSLGKSQVAAVVEDYLTALRDEDYVTARRQLCPEQQKTHSVGWFQDRYSAAKVTDFTVDANDVRIDQQILVPARVREGGNWVDEQYTMEQDGARYVICGGVD